MLRRAIIHIIKLVFVVFPVLVTSIVLLVPTVIAREAQLLLVILINFTLLAEDALAVRQPLHVFIDLDVLGLA